jgi:formate dehydrogenase iron-sulfur subunit
MLVKSPMQENRAEADDIKAIVEQFQGLPGALLPLLHAVQSRQGYVAPEWVPAIADGLNLSRAEVHGVISFYPDFHSQPRGQHVVQVCRAEACQAMGSRKLEAHAKKVLAVDYGETTLDGEFTLEPVYCLGNCACSPSIRVDNRIIGQVDAALFDQVIADVDKIESSTVSSSTAESFSYQFYLSRDTSALAVDAEAVAERLQASAIESDLEVNLVRTGSRGLFYLEPLLEVDINQKRIGFGPVTAADIDSIVSALATDPSIHPLYLGLVDELDYLSQQQRITFARAGLGDPVCLDNYQNLAGFDGLRKALLMTQQEIVDQIKQSGLRGRGGAAFPAGIKLQTVLDTTSEQKFVVCNADEGDSGTFADRLLMEADPYQLIEGMIIAGLAVDASQGYIYLRSEYPVAHQMLNAAIQRALEAGFLGRNILGSSKDFHLEVRLGAGAYICGEETAMLDSLEGKRGIVRVKPPLPAIQGLFEQPTVVNNVLTLAAMSSILQSGGDAYQSMGSGRSRGTLVVQLAGNVKRGGLVEVPFGLTLRELVETYGQGCASGRAMRAIQVGGPLGAFLPESQWDTPLDYEAFTEIDAMIGHGGVVVFDDTVDMAAQARFSMEFCAVESCGKCTPCRIGSTRGLEVIDRITSDQERQENIMVLQDLCDTMEAGSLCAMGGMTPFPVRSAINYFPEDFSGELA